MANIIVIAKNNTESPISIQDLGGVTIPASSQLSLCGESSSSFGIDGIYTVQQSNDLIEEVASTDVTINDGVNDLTSSEGILWVVTGKTTEPRDVSHKMRVHVTPRKLGLTTYFTTVGDDITDITKVGGGSTSTNILNILHEVGDSTTQSVYFDLNIAENETWIYEGYVQCSGAKGDLVTFEIVPVLTEYTADQTDTNYNLYGGYLIIPAAGDGTISLDNDMTDPRDGLIYMPDNDLCTRPSTPCYWDADFNTTSHEFESIDPNYTGDGYYNMFGAEVCLGRFVNKFGLLGSQGFRLDSYDCDQLGQGMRLKMTAYTVGDDHEWQLTAGVTFFRKHTS